MAQELTILVPLRRSRTGLAATLRAQLYDDAVPRVAVGSLITTGFTEVGQGHYTFSHTAYPDGFEGSVDFVLSTAPTVPLAAIALNNASFAVPGSAGVASIAAAVWAYASRTLTMTVAAIVAALTSSGVISIRRANTATVNLTGLGSLAGRSKLWVTVKESVNDTDAQAILQWEETAGLLRLNGAAATASDGTLTVTNATTGAITLTLKAPAAAVLELADRLTYDVKVLIGTTLSATAPKRFSVDDNVTMSVV